MQKKRDRHGERGVALVVTLLLVSLTVAMGLVMYLAVSSDMLINGFYRNFRGAFYAADSGMNIARAEITNQITAAIPVVFAIPPIANPDTLAANVSTFLTTQYGGFSSLNASNATNSWAENFKVSAAAVTLAPGSPVVISRDAMNNPTGYSYIFNYSLTSTGNAQGTEQSVVSETGSVTLNITGAANVTTVSFAGFGFFVNNYAQCQAPLVPGTVTGPVFTNGAWEFYTAGPYIFTDPVGQANQNADYWFNGQCFPADASNLTVGGQTIAPTFQGGFTRGQNPAPLPQNDFSQKRAVIDGLGTTPTDPTNAELNAVLKDLTGTAYPVGGAASGVYMPFSVVGSAYVMGGGGIYVKGDSTVDLAPSGASAQVYTISQGGAFTTVTVDPLATPPGAWNCPGGTVGTTTMVSGGTTTNICSVTKNLINNTKATMLFDDGNITSLKGPGVGLAGVNDHAQVTITAHGNVTITGDILYKTAPVTTTQNQIVAGTNPACCAGTPIDTLIPGHDFDQSLGVFSTTGNVQLNNVQGGSNLEIDASVATISAGGSGCIVNVGSGINTLNIVGGRIQSSICGIGATTRNIYFDRRYTNRPGFTPPWFPSTTLTQGGALSTNVTATTQRLQWLNQTTVQ